MRGARSPLPGQTGRNCPQVGILACQARQTSPAMKFIEDKSRSYTNTKSKARHLNGRVEESIARVLGVAGHKPEAGQSHCGVEGDRDLVPGL